jgi:hypothetical protein
MIQVQQSQVTFGSIVRLLQEVPVDRLSLIHDFIVRQTETGDDSGALRCAIASEALLAQEWDTPEEDAAWANL